MSTSPLSSANGLCLEGWIYLCFMAYFVVNKKINKGIHFHILNVPGKIRPLSHVLYTLHFQRWMGVNEIKHWLGSYPQAFFFTQVLLIYSSRLEGDLYLLPGTEACLPKSLMCFVAFSTEPTFLHCHLDADSRTEGPLLGSVSRGVELGL